MPAVLRRSEPTGANYVHRFGISQSVLGGDIVKVIDEVMDFVEGRVYKLISLAAPSDLTVT